VSEPHLDRCQFDPRVGARSHLVKQLWKILGDEEIRGFGETGPIRIGKHSPEWVYDMRKVRDFLLSVRCQNGTRGRYAAIIYLYYRCGMSKQDVADELTLSPGIVCMTLDRIKKLSCRFFNGLGEKCYPPEPDYEGTSEAKESVNDRGDDVPGD
jgi:hypothetical protein